MFATVAILGYAGPAHAQYIGDAYGLNLNLNPLNLLNLGTTIADTGALPSAGGGPFTANLLNATVGTGGLGGLGATTGVINTSTQGLTGVVNSSAVVNNLSVLPPLLDAVSLTATTVTSSATASSSGEFGSSTITGLHFGGNAITVTGAVNQTVVDALGNTLIINEQIHNANGSLTVNALGLQFHRRLPGSNAGTRQPGVVRRVPGQWRVFRGAPWSEIQGNAACAVRIVKPLMAG
jgi:hypothetical protein